MPRDHEQTNSFCIDIKTLAEDRGISKEVCIQCVKEAFLNTLIKKYPKTIVDDFLIEYDNINSMMLIKMQTSDEDKSKDVCKSRKKNKGGDEGINIKEDFNDKDVSFLRTQLEQRVAFEKEKSFYEKYKKAIGELIFVKFYRFCKGYDIVKDEEGNELIFRESEKGDFKKKTGKDYRRRFTGLFKVYVKTIENTAGKVRVFVSRAGEYFIRKLLEENISEINKNGSVVIKKIARDINSGRTTVVVDSIDDMIDCIGTCIGTNKCRLNAITKELNNETVVFVRYSDDLSVFIANVLCIPRIEAVNISEKKRYIIYVNDDYYALALLHAKLLQLLLSNEKGKNKIEIYRYVPVISSLGIDQLKLYFDDWIVNEIKRDKEVKTLEDIVNKYTQEEFGTKFDLEEETVDNIYTVSAELIKRKKEADKK